MLKRAYHETYHHNSPEHLDRYVREFAGKHNVRNCDTIEQMISVVMGLVDKRPMYRDLIADRSDEWTAEDIERQVARVYGNQG